ncbi:MAG: hypothetical protein ACHQYP_09875 [Nitrospiria bacterium]
MKIFELLDDEWVDVTVVREGQVVSDDEEECLIPNLPTGPFGEFDQITFDDGRIFGYYAD